MTNHPYYSMRKGSNPAKDGLTLNDLKKLFKQAYNSMDKNGYFDESFYAYEECYGDRKPKIPDVESDILLKIRKESLWPINKFIENYSEDDLFDIIEFLHIHVSKPINAVWDGYLEINCCDEFDKAEGQKEFREKINEILGAYIGKFELSKNGEILEKPKIGFEKIFKADIPSNDEKVRQRINSAIRLYRRHGATVDDRRHAVKDLIDVCERLRSKVKSILTKKDEQDLFNIANNFGIRHYNEIQKTDYDVNLWMRWMFYFYLATIHFCLRKIEHTKS